MSVQIPTPLEKEILDFQDKIQRMLDNVGVYHESLMRDEESLKRLLERIGEIPNIKRPNNEHETDT